MKLEEIKIRSMETKEYSLLGHFLYDAIYQPKDSILLPKEVINQPELAIYIQDFGESEDNCLVAELQGKIIGAV